MTPHLTEAEISDCVFGVEAGISRDAQDHWSTCEDCQQRVAQWKELIAQLNVAASPTEAQSEESLRRVLGKLLRRWRSTKVEKNQPLEPGQS